MKKIAILVSLLTLAVTLGSCTKGCKKPEAAPPPAEEKLEEKKEKDEAAPPGHPEGDRKVEPGQGQERKDLMNELQLKEGDKLYAEFDISQGNKSLGKIKTKLFWDKAPMTVRNFVELAMGKKEWVSPKGEKTDGTPIQRHYLSSRHQRLHDPRW